MTDFFLADSDATELLGQWLAATRPPQALIELRAAADGARGLLPTDLLAPLRRLANPERFP
ncbi:hypothetical protein C7E14_22325 [Stenotrophomonas maltophilia]|nr:hypothetical protein C7E14_22325 [Stenotrophomonas maltophilia]